jgi:small-conductance mechanosensitive channel
MEVLKSLLETLYSIWTFELLSFSSTSLTLSKVVSLITFFLVLLYSTSKIRKLIVTRILARTSWDIGVRQAIGSITRYILVTLGLFIMLQSIGIDLSTITVIVGALGVGLGFGLQTVTDNFVSGLIILLERPIKVGDRVQVGNIDGDVTNISIRATTVLTNDNIAIIVPNSQFVSSTVINWSHADNRMRFKIKVGVSYKSDPEIVNQALLEAASEHEGVLKDPQAEVIFDTFGDNSLNFWLWVWTSSHISRPSRFRSEMNFLIHKKLKKYNIEIPFPQRDIHLKSGFEQTMIAPKNPST